MKRDEMGFLYLSVGLCRAGDGRAGEGYSLSFKLACWLFLLISTIQDVRTLLTRNREVIFKKKKKKKKKKKFILDKGESVKKNI
jgi:hypothetical protein